MSSFKYSSEDKWRPHLQDIITSIYEGNGQQAIEILQVLEQAAGLRHNKISRDLQLMVIETPSTVFSTDDSTQMMQEMADAQTWYGLAATIWAWSNLASEKSGAF